MAKYEEKKKKREKERQKFQKKQDRKANAAGASYWFLAPLIMIFSFIPLVVYAYKFDTHLGSFDWYVHTETQVDLFLHSKMVLFLMTCVYIIGTLVYLFIKHRDRIKWIWSMIPLVAYGVLTLVSAIASDNSYFSYHGIAELFEPVWVLLGYCLVTYYSFLVLQSEESVKKIIPWFIAGITVMLAIGVGQSLGFDLLRTSFGARLVVPASMKDVTIDFQEGMAKTYLTSGNPNYVGVYIILILPILIELTFLAKKLWSKILMLILILTSVWVLVASGSKAGVLVLPISFILLLVLHRQTTKKYWKIIAAFTVAGILLFGGMELFGKTHFISRVMSAIELKEDKYPLESIETGENCVRITYNGNVLDFSMIQNADGSDALQVVDGEGKEIDAEFDTASSAFAIKDARFPFFFNLAASENFKGFVVIINGRTWVFSNRMEEGDSSYYAYVGKIQKPTKLYKNTETYNAFLEKHPSIFSKRGYIWARALNILKKNLLLGTGPDTFFVAFPNEDLVNMYNSGFVLEYISKPHSFYLQIATQMGLPALLCMLIFIGWYLFDSFKIYWKAECTGYLSCIGKASLVAVIGFLIMGLTNDSIIGVSPIFYLVLGMGIGINYTLKNRIGKDAKE